MNVQLGEICNIFRNKASSVVLALTRAVIGKSLSKIRKERSDVMKHTVKFETLLNSHCPNYKQAQAWLEKYGNSL
jgi:hypothetical protein